MPLLIDAYNVLHITGVLPPDLAGIGVAELCELIATSRYRAMPATLVLDGAAPGADHRGRGDRASLERTISPDIHLRYAGAGRDADTLIERMIRKESAPGRLIVVSSDRRLRRAAERRGSRAMRSEDFLARLAHDRHRLSRVKTQALQAYEIPLDPGSITWWLGYFGVDAGDELARLKAQGPRRAPEPRPASEATNSQRDHDPSPAMPGSKGAADDGRQSHTEDEMIDVDDIDMEDWM